MSDASTLGDVVARFQSSPAVRSKASLRLISEVFGASDWVHGPGDDTAVLECGDQHILAAGEAIWPPLVEADPFAAGVASVVTNVNDVAAMGGRGLALIDQVVAPEEIAREVLEGIRFAAGIYGLPVAGGHLTLWDGPPSVSASIVGRAARPLSSTNVAPGQVCLLASCLQGEMRTDFPVFSSIKQRGAELAGDVELLPGLAEEGLIAAAKDVSMAGLLGSLAMLLEPARNGMVADLDAVDTPEETSLAEWTGVFPNYAFLMTASAEHAEDVQARFYARGLSCAVLGTIDDTGLLRARLGGEEARLLDLKAQTVTGLNRATASGR